MAALYQLLGVGQVGVLALGLDVGAAGAADIGTFIPVEAAGTERVIDDLGRAFDEALPVYNRTVGLRDTFAKTMK